MLVVTTPTIAGYRIVQRLGIVSGEAILGANIFKNFFRYSRRTGPAWWPRPYSERAVGALRQLAA